MNLGLAIGLEGRFEAKGISEGIGWMV